MRVKEGKMKTETLTMRIDPDLRQQVQKLAKIERRTVANQCAYLLDIGLRALEAENATRRYYLVPEILPAETTDEKSVAAAL
jgi:hypothetical protein